MTPRSEPANPRVQYDPRMILISLVWAAGCSQFSFDGGGIIRMTGYLDGECTGEEIQIVNGGSVTCLEAPDNWSAYIVSRIEDSNVVISTIIWRILKHFTRNYLAHWLALILGGGKPVRRYTRANCIPA